MTERYARRPWPIFPIGSTTTGNYVWDRSDDASDSVAALLGVGVAEATASLPQVGRWFKEHADAGIGLATGSASGPWALVVRGEAGRKALEGWVPSGERLPFTPQAKLPPDVSIYLFRMPGGQLITTTKLAGGMIAVVGEGGWVPLPPSASDEGTWEWEVPPSHASLAVAPAWLLPRIAPNQPAPGRAGGSPKAIPTPASTPAIVSVRPPFPDVADVPNEPRGASALVAGLSSSPVPAGSVDIKLDPEFARFIPPQTAEERDQLEANLLAEGCRDPLTVWEQTGVLLDGYNRFELCTKHGIPFDVVTVCLVDRQAAKQWILKNQFGRRNLTSEATAYLRGKLYEAEKQPPGGMEANRPGQRADGTVHGGKNCHPGKTADRLARSHQVSPRTIRNDAQFARAIDQIAANCGEQARDLLLCKTANLRQQEVVWLAGKDVKMQQQVVKIVEQTGRWKCPPKGKSDKPKSASKESQQARPAESNSTATPVLTVLPGADPLKLADQLRKLLGAKKFSLLSQAMSKLRAYGRSERPTNSGSKGKAAGAARKKTRAAAAGR